MNLNTKLPTFVLPSPVMSLDAVPHHNTRRRKPYHEGKERDERFKSHFHDFRFGVKMAMAMIMTWHIVSNTGVDIYTRASAKLRRQRMKVRPWPSN
jgi:hypothetical protein